MDRGPHVAVHARKKRSLRHTVRLSRNVNALMQGEIDVGSDEARDADCWSGF